MSLALAVRHLIRPSPQIPSKDEPPRFPTEIFLHIISYIGERSALLTLCRVSRQFRPIAQEALYRSLDLSLNYSYQMTNALDSHRQTLLFRTLQSPIGLAVTELRVHLDECEVHDSSYLGKLFRPCKCNEHDSAFGQALASLQNLVILRLRCNLPRSSDIARVRHLYLRHLKASRLSELLFHCNCSTSDDNTPYDILTAPCMNSVSFLHWKRYMNNMASADYIQSLLGPEECLPNLSRIMSAEPEVLVPFISKGHITHLGCYTIQPYLQTALQRHPGTLTHLHADSISFLSSLAQEPNVYRNLRYIGGITYWDKPINKILQLLRPLTCLPKLNSLGIDHSYSGTRFDKKLPGLLGLRHPTLQEVYVNVSVEKESSIRTVREYYLWKRIGTSDRWTCERIPAFNEWDLLVSL